MMRIPQQVGNASGLFEGVYGGEADGHSYYSKPNSKPKLNRKLAQGSGGVHCNPTGVVDRPVRGDFRPLVASRDEHKRVFLIRGPVAPKAQWLVDVAAQDQFRGMFFQFRPKIRVTVIDKVSTSCARAPCRRSMRHHNVDVTFEHGGLQPPR